MHQTVTEGLGFDRTVRLRGGWWRGRFSKIPLLLGFKTGQQFASVF